MRRMMTVGITEEAYEAAQYIKRNNGNRSALIGDYLVRVADQMAKERIEGKCLVEPLGDSDGPE